MVQTVFVIPKITNLLNWIYNFKIGSLMSQVIIKITFTVRYILNPKLVDKLIQCIFKLLTFIYTLIKKYWYDKAYLWLITCYKSFSNIF